MRANPNTPLTSLGERRKGPARRGSGAGRKLRGSLGRHGELCGSRDVGLLVLLYGVVESLESMSSREQGIKGQLNNLKWIGGCGEWW